MLQKKLLKYSINYLFIIILLTTFSLIGYVVFTSWTSSIETIIADIQSNTNQRLLVQIDQFINNPLIINEANRSLLEQNIIDLSDRHKRNVYFSSVIEANQEDIYSFSYGSETGDYFGARRNDHNEIEVYENTLSTNGRTRYYAVNRALESTLLVQETAPFDVRTRDWYSLAKKTRKAVFSPIYKHFVMNDLAISAAYPIYNKAGTFEGVLGTHLTLSRMNQYLQDLVKSNKGLVYIVEKDTGYLVANSLGEPNFLIYSENGQTVLERKQISEVQRQSITKAYENYKNSQGATLFDENDSEKLYVTVLEYNKEGLHWLILSAIPATPFTAAVTNSIKMTLGVSLLAVLTAILLYIKSTGQVLKPIYHLIETTRRFSAGDFKQRATIFRDDEVGTLAHSFNTMAEQIHEFVNHLEAKIYERTAELEEANEKLALRTGELKAEKDLAVKRFNELNALHDIAAEVQLGFLPEPFENEFIRAQYLFKPIEKLSGDILDFIWLEDHEKLCGFIVDVSGHGLIAALRTHILHGLFHDMYLSGGTLSEKMAALNQQALRYFDEASYAAILFFEIDFKTAMLRIVSGGNYYMIASCESKQGVVKLPGSLVGLLPINVEYSTVEIPLQTGNVFVFGSDGLFDLLKEEEFKSFSYERLYQQLTAKTEQAGRWDDASAIFLEIKKV